MMENLDEDLKPSTGKEAVYPANGIIRIYNQFPRCYLRGIVEMTEQLPQIRQQGFNVVWVNPIHQTGEVVVDRRIDNKPVKVKGSIYAIRSLEHFNDQFFHEIPNHKDRVSALQNYTRTAKALGIIPIFDLVLNQVAIESDYCHTFKAQLKQQKGKQTLWDDTLLFDYSKEENREILFHKLWKPHIDFYLKDLGFMGVRMDAVKHLDPIFLGMVCKYLHQSCQSLYGQNAVIFGELLDKNPTKHVQKLKEQGITHILNNAYYGNFSHEALCQWDQSWLPTGLSKLRTIASSSSPDLTITGGTVGFVGNHDINPLHQSALKLLPSHEMSPDLLLSAMKRQAFCIAMISDAGWYMQSGDEFGCDTKFSVFDHFRTNSTFREHWEGRFDLTTTIRGINAVLDHSMPSNSMQSVELMALPDCPDIVIARRIFASGDHFVICNTQSKPIESENFYKIRDKIMSSSKNVSCVDVLDCDKLTRLNGLFEVENKVTLESTEVADSESSSIINKGFQ